MTDLQHAARRVPLTGYILSAAGAVLFATKGVLVKLIYAYGVDTTTLLAWRMALATPVFLGVGLLHWARLAPAARPGIVTLAKAAAVGVLGYYVSSWLDFEGLQTLEAQTERLILFTYPLLVILFGAMFFGRPLTSRALVAAAFSYGGIFVMFAGAPHRADSLGGGALVLMAAATFAVYQLLAADLIRQAGAALFTAVAMTAAGAAVMVHYAVSRSELPAGLPAEAIALVVVLAVFATVVPAFIMSAGTARIGAQGTAIVSSVSPIATVLLAVAVLNEPFGPSEAVGTLLVLGGVSWFTWRESRARQKPVAKPDPLKRALGGDEAALAERA
jgi:drug/metabolite transporter (DMT)-like permease